MERPSSSRNIFQILDFFVTEGSDIEEEFDNSDLDPDYIESGISKRSKSTGRIRKKARFRSRSRSSSSYETDTDYSSSSDPSHPGPSKRKRKKKKTRSRPRSISVPSPGARPAPIDPDPDSDDAEMPQAPEDSEPEPEAAEDGWVRNMHNFPLPPPFPANPGIQFQVEDDFSPKKAYDLIITNDLIKFFKAETNRYAREVFAIRREKGDLKEHSRIHQWTAVKQIDIQGFLLILIHMALITKHEIEDYWSTKGIIHSPFVGKIMSRNRFQNILSMFHLCNNQHYGHDPLFKLRHMYDHLRQTFQALFVPYQNVALDETICGWRGPLRFTIYIKDKPVSRGIKLYMLTDSNSAFVFDFEVYAMESHISNRPHDVVMRLMAPL
ncbi:PiggyBac transposable element-derived protein 4 [Plakobranchus ocellatus]|uniref:PiggyBac transposable element-derived protein 4 n=1 Tax=Plakobranchus ocellatus TaxID=259542 RepID=A0AAV4AML1_9GAST|nr:PiggyBac transposable element-derived protein 4 [Plakobranchus ocellatus]